MLEGINYLHAKFQINILKNKKVLNFKNTKKSTKYNDHFDSVLSGKGLSFIKNTLLTFADMVAVSCSVTSTSKGLW